MYTARNVMYIARNIHDLFLVLLLYRKLLTSPYKFVWFAGHQEVNFNFAVLEHG